MASVIPKDWQSPEEELKHKAHVDDAKSMKTRRLFYEDMHLPVATRLNDKGKSGIMGHCERSPMTGAPILKSATIMADFCIMDLWERTALYGSPEDLVRDPYIYKIVPLAMRTWLYHQYFNDRDHNSRAGGDHGIMDQVLEAKVIDTDRHAGRWSPALMYAPATFLSIFTADFTTAIGCIVMCVFNMTFSILNNTPRWFSYSRWMTLTPRIVFFFFVLVRMFQRAGDGGVIVILIFLVMLTLLIIDFILGDVQALWGLGWCCHYEILRVLPNRIFVCRKHGAAFVQDPEGGRKISQVVTGISYFDEMTLIAERGGLVVQLKPMNEDDFASAWEIRTEHSRPVPFVGMDVFNKERKTIDDIELGLQVQTADGAKEALINMVAQGHKVHKSSQEGAPEFLE